MVCNGCSASICVVYTLFGGLYAVAYTDVAQLALIIIGLFMALPNIFTNDYVDHEVLWQGAKMVVNESVSFEGKPGWIGEIAAKGEHRLRIVQSSHLRPFQMRRAGRTTSSC